MPSLGIAPGPEGCDGRLPDGVITNPNCVLAGVVGKGKSTLAKSLATRSIAFGRRVYVPGDPKGEWTPVTEAFGGAATTLGPGSSNRLNPLDAGPRPTGTDPAAWAAQVGNRRRGLLGSLVEATLGRPMTALEHTALDVALTTVVHGLRRLVSGDLAGLFDGPSTVTVDPTLPMVSLDLSAIQGSDQLIAMVTSCASASMEAALADPGGGQRWVIYDEAWRLLRQPALLTRMQSQWKLSRALGIANLMIIHRLSDLDAVGDADSQARALATGLLADCSTKIIYQQETVEAPHTAHALGLSTTEQAQLPDLQQGEGLWRVGQRALVVRHLLTDGEQFLFDTNTRMTGRPGVGA